MKSYFWSASLLAGWLLTTVNVYAQEREPDPNDRGEEWQGAARDFGTLKTEIPNIHFNQILFEAIENVTLLDFGFGKDSFALQAKRRVFENNDLQNSRTV